MCGNKYMADRPVPGTAWCNNSKVRNSAGGRKLIHLIGQFSVQYRGIFLRVSLYFGEPVGRVKIQETSDKLSYVTIQRVTVQVSRA